MRSIPCFLFGCLSFGVSAADVSDSKSDETQKALIGAGESLLKNGASGLQANLTNRLTGAATSEINQAGKSFLEQYFPYSEFSVGLGTPSKPTYGALIVAPLSNPDDVVNTIFNQTSVYHNNGRTTVNIGFGYRRLAYDKKVLLGINGFYDQEFPYQHQRTSIGFEARTTVAELNANRYWGMSGWRTVETIYEERALGGTDIELGVALPYMPWAKVYGRKFIWYALDGAADLKGDDISFRAQIPTLPGLVMEAGHRNYQSYSGSNFFRISYNFTGRSNARNQQLFTETAWALQNMEAHRYDKVRRENLIVKQRRSKFGLVFVGYK